MDGFLERSGRTQALRDSDVDVPEPGGFHPAGTAGARRESCEIEGEGLGEELVHVTGAGSLVRIQPDRYKLAARSKDPERLAEPRPRCGEMMEGVDREDS